MQAVVYDFQALVILIRNIILVWRTGAEQVQACDGWNLYTHRARHAITAGPAEFPCKLSAFLLNDSHELIVQGGKRLFIEKPLIQLFLALNAIDGHNIIKLLLVGESRFGAAA